jgi:hypothetical protein
MTPHGITGLERVNFLFDNSSSEAEMRDSDNTRETFKIGYHNKKCPKYISLSGKSFSLENP